ncbi:hypothetical protein EZV73_07410 [Acidaminobacter sp. JC074]|uniref:hypothetical protein n=1 Tax=Acidaminobacter sp. JC074 TaxID=2530199 RepID=UPI001F0F2BE3|nr:hypothetical protein [Acidaminobacter sp. JC074]MCH4887392.1 hypothetical protein [Acidaminobacter sp. JC074]
MQKNIIRIALIVLCLASYLTYSVIHANTLRSELIAHINKPNLNFVEEHKRELLRHSYFSSDNLQSVYDKKFNDGTWSLVKMLDKAVEYRHLYGQLPIIESGSIEVTLDDYLIDYFLEEVVGGDVVKSSLYNLEEITQNVGFKSADELLRDCYHLNMSLFLNSQLSHEEVIDFHSKLEAFTGVLETSPSQMFTESMPDLLSQYTTYKEYESAREKMKALSHDVNEKDFYNAIKSISNLMDAPLTPSYTINDLDFKSDSNTFIIPLEDVKLIRDKGLDREKMANEFYDYLDKDNRVISQTLESNKVYYIVSANDYLHIDQIEIVYTFDGDYGQFFYGNDSEEVLNKRIKELGYGSNYLEKYDITYLDNLSDIQLDEYRSVVNGVLGNYGEIIMPIMISNKVTHYFHVEDGRYYTKTKLMFDPLVDTSDMMSDITFYAVEKVSSDQMEIAGLAMPSGILIIQDSLSMNKSAKSTIHHEIMHQIDRYYNNRHNIRLYLSHPDFKYLDKRDLSKEDYVKTFKTENFSSKSVLSRLDYGMTSYYSGLNKQEHLAELWSDLVMNYDLYEDEFNKHPAFDENVNKLIIFMNEIIETVDGDKIETVEDLLRFDGDITK